VKDKIQNNYQHNIVFKNESLYGGCHDGIKHVVQRFTHYNLFISPHKANNNLKIRSAMIFSTAIVLDKNKLSILVQLEENLFISWGRKDTAAVLIMCRAGDSQLHPLFACLRHSCMQKILTLHHPNAVIALPIAAIPAPVYIQPAPKI
jgi:hypothetical protein